MNDEMLLQHLYRHLARNGWVFNQKSSARVVTTAASIQLGHSKQQPWPQHQHGDLMHIFDKSRSRIENVTKRNTLQTRPSRLISRSVGLPYCASQKRLTRRRY